MKKKHFKLLVLFIITVSCKSVFVVKKNKHIYVQKDHDVEKEWRLIWKDDFSKEELDLEKWTKIPPNSSDWGKYLTDEDECYMFSDGNLYLRGLLNEDKTKDSRPYLTGGIYTKGKFAFQYGKIEIRVKLESAQGAWPAIWMLSEKNSYGDYPKNGEIDIMEHLNFDDIIYQTVHSYYTLELKKTEDPISYSTTKFNNKEFNVFGLEWYPDKLVFTLNGETTFIYENFTKKNRLQWPFDQPFYLLIDQQLGGTWVGEIDSNDLPVQMIVDYVKVYQK